MPQHHESIELLNPIERKRLRVFLGIPLSDDIHKLLCKQQMQLKKSFHHEKLRWIKPENFHITLAFIGGVNYQQVFEIVDKVKVVSEEYSDINIKIDEIASFPTPISRIIAVNTELPPLLEKLYLAIKGALEEIDIMLEKRPYKPHITLAKFRQPSSIQPIALPDLTMPMKEFVLFQSKPTDEGSLYIPLYRFKLC